jgi:hypothetical protein
MTQNTLMIKSIMENAAKREGGLTPWNVYLETVDHYVFDRFGGLAQRKEGEKPTTKELAEVVLATAEEIYQLNPGLAPAEQYNDYIRNLQEHPEAVEHLRPVYDKLVLLLKSESQIR